MAKAMSMEEVLALPAVTDFPTACKAWGLGETNARKLHKAGQLPFEVLRLGRTLRVRKADLLASLGYQPDGAPADDAEAAS